MYLKKISLLGSTGSIGKNTIKIIKDNKDKFEVTALVANSNVDLLANQAIEVSAKYAVIADESLYLKLKELLAHTNIKVAAGYDAVINVAKIKVDLTISAIVGVSALEPTLEAIRSGNNIGLANKECLVCAGSLMMSEAKKYNSKIIPIDSEHSAISQLLRSGNIDNINRIILTASGGPFRNTHKADLANVTKQQALNHPTWNMGAKITIDSATMMNKGLEVIEAFYLFDFKLSQIDVVIHPESIIHSMVEYKDGSMISHMSVPDMKLPISHALLWPDMPNTKYKSLDFTNPKHQKLTFENIDTDKFQAVNLAKQALEKGGAYPIIFNIVNEIAVSEFLKDNIRFVDIVNLVAQELSKFPNLPVDNISDIFNVIKLLKNNIKINKQKAV